MKRSTIRFTDPAKVADTIVESVGRNIVLALPLGLGKANHVVNALTDLALADSSISLDIVTALTLETPQLDNDFKRRLLGPALKRLFGEYPSLRYAELLRSGKLPANIRVTEFFLLAGQWLAVDQAQQRFIPANYTHALRFLLDRGVNVVAQLLATHSGTEDLSLSCNPDITADLLQLRAAGRCDFQFVGQLNDELPYMEGAARIEPTEVDLLLHGDAVQFELFSVPKRPVRLADYAVGLHAARLVRDGGTLQIGIGAVGDAVSRALVLRHQKPARFKALLDQLDGVSDTGLEEYNSFVEGIYGVSEMFVDGFLQLAEHGILKREAGGAILHGAFFADCRDFYRRLRDLGDERRRLFQMMPVSFTNDLYDDEEAKRQARVKASFINSAMMVTLRGAVISDALENGRVVSGVGGQYNFAAQAFALQDARFIITLNATRQHRGRTLSNIVWSYGHETLPTHLRDIVITEYGVADLRGKTENEAVKAMLAICDARFQDGLLARAVDAGKLEADWQIPSRYRGNTPESVTRALEQSHRDGTLDEFPFGTDFTEVECKLLQVLDVIQRRAHSRMALAALALQGLTRVSLTLSERRILARMEPADYGGSLEFIQRQLLKAALFHCRDGEKVQQEPA